MLRQSEQRLADFIVVGHPHIAFLDQLSEPLLLARNILALRLALGYALPAPLDEFHVDKSLVPRFHAAAGRDLPSARIVACGVPVGAGFGLRAVLVVRIELVATVGDKSVNRIISIKPVIHVEPVSTAVLLRRILLHEYGVAAYFLAAVAKTLPSVSPQNSPEFPAAKLVAGIASARNLARSSFLYEADAIVKRLVECIASLSRLLLT